MNDLVKFAGSALPANPQALVSGLGNVASSLQVSSGGVPFLRLLRTGLYAYGAEKIEPQPGSQWAVNPYSIEHGWSCWIDGELMGEVLVAFNQPLPAQNTLQDYGGEWRMCVSMQLQCLNGEDQGLAVVFKGTSVGLRNAVKALIQALVSQIAADPVNYVPVVELETDSYPHKKYGEIFVPILNVMRWVSMGGPTEQPDAEVPPTTAAEVEHDAESPPREGAEPETPQEAAPAPRGRPRRAGKKAAAAEGNGQSQPRQRRQRRAAVE